MMLRVTYILFIVSLSGLCSAESSGYPSDFMWGAAISAHQVEGVAGGGENSDWWQFELGGHTSGDTTQWATDHWHRYPEDFEIASQMGLNSVRISLAWEKIEPSRDKFDADVMGHYREVLKSMRSRGLRPLVTLFHGTVPVWFHDSGGWLAKSSPDDFLKYVDFTVRSLSDLCDFWVTFNEPMIFVGLGYLEGTIPPQVSSVIKTLKAGENVVRAHHLATARIHDIQPRHEGRGVSGVGIVSGLDIYDPMRPSNLWDRWVAKIVDELSNWTLLSAAVYGKLSFFGSQVLLGYAGLELSTVRKSLLRVRDSFAEGRGRAQVDWVGVNHYTISLIRSKFMGRPEFIYPVGPKGDNGWAYDPSAFERILRQTAARFQGIPIVVTENGVADKSDLLRQRMIVDSLAAMDRAMNLEPRAPVKGYYHWSLTDNFEWEEGYKTRFGLVEVRYQENFKRVVRPSFDIYRDEIRKRDSH